MDKILNSLLITAALSSLLVLAVNTPRTTMEDGRNRVEFTLLGKASCVMVDDKIFCAPAVTPSSIKLASIASN